MRNESNPPGVADHNVWVHCVFACRLFDLLFIFIWALKAGGQLHRV